jgi:epoxyqueuosine reductase
LVGHRIFGCDVCQTVCPWNRRWSRGDGWPEWAPRPELDAPSAVDMLTMTRHEFSTRFKGSPIKRAKRAGLARNAAVALGNLGDRAAVAALAHVLRSDDEALVRGHAAWALGRLGGNLAATALGLAADSEPDPWVADEVRVAQEAL